jgi:hypothetical protein
MKLWAWDLLLALPFVPILAGCHTVDPAAEALARMDRAPVGKRPKNWEQTKTLMARVPPRAGQPAPDFSLRTLHGRATISRSAQQAGRPQVLIFGSFT